MPFAGNEMIWIIEAHVERRRRQVGSFLNSCRVFPRRDVKMKPTIGTADGSKRSAVTTYDNDHPRLVSFGVRRFSEPDAPLDDGIFWNLYPLKLLDGFLSVQEQRGIAATENLEPSMKFESEKQILLTIV